MKDELMTNSMTQGAHHIGLTVAKLEESAAFFTSILGWQVVKRNNEYPAIFVSDGTIMLTLWNTKQTPIVEFDKNRNVGLHHLALKVASEKDLHAIHSRLIENNVKIEFSPEQLGQSPARHMMCYEPSGLRIEFIWPGT